MASQKDFDTFLSKIEPKKTTVSYISSVQSNLRDYLKNHESYGRIHLDTFLSGSYAKHTSIRPVLNDKKRDVDIVVVTNHSENDDSVKVLDELKRVLIESKTYESAHLQSHSVSIEMGGISIDVVPVIIGQSDETIYEIGDSQVGDWQRTDPKGHIQWSSNFNKTHNDEYVPLVKILKWWRRLHCPKNYKYPKGITLEKIIADNIGDTTLSTEGLLIETMQNIISAYQTEYVEKKKNPVIDDPSEKIVGNDLLAGYTIGDFSKFIEKLTEHIDLLNSTGVTNETWKKVLGDDFPASTNQASTQLATVEEHTLYAPHRRTPPWPYQRGNVVFIEAKVTNMYGDLIEYQSNGASLPKHCSLDFKAITGVKQPYQVFWQIVNTGREAAQANCLRGGFDSFGGQDKCWHETTLYTGSHSVQCFIVKGRVCVAKSKEFIINIA